MHRRLLGLLVGGLLFLAPAAAALAGSPADVTVRVEGKSATLLPSTLVHTTTTPVQRHGHSCSGTSAIGALDTATHGQWEDYDPYYFNGYFVDGILGETYDPTTNSDYWAFWMNNKQSSVGVCDAELQTGDQILFFVARCDVGPPPDYACTNPPVLPLGLTAPSTVDTGVPFNVTVVEYATDGTSTPEAGATVSGGGTSATTDANGVATLTLSQSGATTLRATNTNRAPSDSVPVCAHAGDDGNCGTTAPGQPAPATTPCQHTGDDGRCGTIDRTPAAARITSILEQQHFAHGRAPRELRGTVAPDVSGLRDVRLRLTRNDRGHCATFDGATTRFRRLRRCGAVHGTWFSVGDRADWSYLLPTALGRGRYVLDVDTTDNAGNRDTLQRGRNRVVFFVG